MSNQKSEFKEADFSFHPPVDPTDPGFAIRGYKFRWVSGHVEMRRGGRIWRPLKLSQLPKKVVDRLQTGMSSWISEGDTIRRRDLTLAVAPLEQVEAYRRNNIEAQRSNEGAIRGKSSPGTGIESEAQMTQEKVESSSASQFR